MVIKETTQASDFLKQFTLSILKAIEYNEFNIPETKIIVDADLIPELSRELMREYMQNRELLRKLHEIESMDFLEAEAPQLKPLSHSQHKGLKRIGLGDKIKSKKKPIIKTPVVIDEGDGYQKIKPFLDDYTVSRIQCIAPLKPIIIIRSGQKQVTRITLSKNEIGDVFGFFADTSHIPLIEGPFKIMLENMELNGVYSKITDSRFIIQKKTAYSLLEKQGRPMMMRH